MFFRQPGNLVNTNYNLIKKHVAAILIISALSSQASAAIVTIQETPWGDPVIHLQGQIEEGDFEKIKSTAIDVINGGNPAQFSMNSPGGSLIEALKIGEFIKEINARTNLFGAHSEDLSAEMTRCYSACFLIFVSGSIRNYVNDNTIWDSTGNVELVVKPIIGLHRPYFDENEFSKLAPSEAREQYNQLELLTRQYLQTVAIPQDIIDGMFRISSQNMQLISLDEFDNKIGFYQPYYEEWIISRCGSLTWSEKNDHARVIAENIRTGRKDSVPSGISQGYIDYLNNKDDEINSCKESALYNHQKEILGISN